jgi:putative hydrolase of the HAD superfamily
MTAGVLFDLDETLLDRHSTLLRCASELFNDLESTARVNKGTFLALVEKLDGRGRAPRADFFAGLARDAFDSIAPSQLSDHFDAHLWLKPLPFDGAKEALQALRNRGVPTGIVTNGSKKSQATKLANSGFADLVDAVVISEEFGSRKPDKRIFLHICEVLRIVPEESWHLGDDPIADMFGASQCGLRTIWIERHLSWPENLDPCYDAKASQVRDVLALLPGGVELQGVAST